MVNTLNGLEKAIAKMESFLLEFRASRASPMMTFPTFDGSEALACLARANQFFLVNKTPSDRRVDIAINAISGPAMPWLKLLLMCCSSLSWDKFTQELLRRFGDAAVRVAKIQPKITPTSNDSTAAILPSLPTVTTPLMSSSSSPPTTALQELLAINTSTNHPDLDTTTYNSTPLPLPLPEQHPIPPPFCITLPSHIRLPTPAMVTAPLLSSSPPTTTKQENTLHASPPNSAKQNSADLHTAAKSAVVSSSFPLAAMASTNPLDELPFAALPPAPPPPPPPPPPQPHLQDVLLRVVPASVVKPTSLLHSSPPPQPQPQFVTTPKLLSTPMLLPLLQQKLFLAQSSADIPQFQPPFFPLRRHTVPAAAAEQGTLMYLFILVHEHIRWFSFAPPVQKHEWEPPPNKVLVSILNSTLRARLFRE